MKAEIVGFCRLKPDPLHLDATQKQHPSFSACILWGLPLSGGALDGVGHQMDEHLLWQ